MNAQHAISLIGSVKTLESSETGTFMATSFGTSVRGS